MYKHILTVEGVGRQTVDKMTLHGLRLWAAEMAFQTQVPRDLRRYIGHLSQENTANTYTREHSSITTKIWTHIFDKCDSAKQRDQLSPDLSDPMYYPDTGEPKTTKLTPTPLEDKPPCTPPRTKQKSAAPSTDAKIPQPKLPPGSKKRQRPARPRPPRGPLHLIPRSPRTRKSTPSKTHASLTYTHTQEGHSRSIGGRLEQAAPPGSTTCCLTSAR
jgi:hypothetical protein